MDVYEIYDIMLDVARKLLHYLDALSLCNASHKTTSQISPDALFKRVKELLQSYSSPSRRTYFRTSERERTPLRRF